MVATKSQPVASTAGHIRALCGCSACAPAEVDRSFFFEPVTVRCSVCERPIFSKDIQADADGRCHSCSVRNAQSTECECLWLYEGERCKCGDCRICERPIGNYEPTAKDAKAVPHDRECEECHGELIRSARRQKRIDDEDARGDYLRDTQRGEAR